MTAPVDPTFFPRHDDLKTKLLTLQGVESSLANSRKALAQERKILAKVEASLQRLDEFAKEQRDRIELVSTHWFCGNTALQPQLWLRDGTEGKIRRARVKLAQAEETRPVIVGKISALNEGISPLLATVEELSADKVQKDFLEDCIDQMRDFAVELNSSPVLKTLQTQVKSNQRVAAVEAANVVALDQVTTLCEKARRHYRNTEEYLSEAKTLNRTLHYESPPHQAVRGPSRPCSTPGCQFAASGTSFFCCGRCSKVPKQHGPKCARQAVTRSCSSHGCSFAVATPASNHCCGRCARSPNEHGPRCEGLAVHIEDEDAVRRREQRARMEASRDHNKRQATNEFESGARLFQSAYDAIPQAVLAKYPALCHPLESAASRSFQRTKMAGFENTATEQLGHVRALHSQLSQDKLNAEMNLTSVESSLDTEKERIFTELRVADQSSLNPVADGSTSMAVAYPVPSVAEAHPAPKAPPSDK